MEAHGGWRAGVETCLTSRSLNVPDAVIQAAVRPCRGHEHLSGAGWQGRGKQAHCFSDGQGPASLTSGPQGISRCSWVFWSIDPRTVSSPLTSALTSLSGRHLAPGCLETSHFSGAFLVPGPVVQALTRGYFLHPVPEDT